MNAKNFVAILLEDVPFDPDVPENPKDELGRVFPTKVVRLGGNDMLYAPGMVQAAQAQFRSRSRADKEHAMKLIKCWPGLSDDEYTAILSGRCEVKPDGDSAVVTIKLWKE
jgi:hypothetical protein